MKKGVTLKKECRFRHKKKVIKGFLVCYVPEEDTIIMMLHLSKKVPIKKTIPVFELLNGLNQHHSAHHLSLHSRNRLVLLTNMFFINDGVIDEEEFGNSIQTTLDYGHELFPIILLQITSNKSPKALMKTFLISVGLDSNACIHEHAKVAVEMNCSSLDSEILHDSTMSTQSQDKQKPSSVKRNG